jgi:hypothetical protein
MKNILAIVSVIALAVGCVGVQKKLADAKSAAKDALPKVECRIKVVEPYVDFILAEDLSKYLDGLSITEVLVAAGVAQEEYEAADAAFKACGKL